MPDVRGDDHLRSRDAGGRPFVVGQITPERGYVHVLDDSSLGVVMQTLDTITDFVWYLQRKETFIVSDRLGVAFGEEDLLAFYLRTLNEEGAHDFVLPPHLDRAFLEQGFWTDFRQRPEVQRKVEADRASRVWDHIIEEVSRHTIAGTLYQTSAPGIAAQEAGLRVLARESRFRRRILGRALSEKINEAVAPGRFWFRTSWTRSPADPMYVFVVGSPQRGQGVNGGEDVEYRRDRSELLRAYCLVAMQHHRSAPCVVGIATEGVTESGRSVDLCMIERSAWDEHMEADATRIRAATGWMERLRITDHREQEFPQDGRAEPAEQIMQKGRLKVGRNAPCPCGSGRKFKRCHGR